MTEQHTPEDSAARVRVAARRAGFTLVEAVMVVVIIGILSAIAIPRMDLESYKVSSAVQGMTATLAYAQRLSITLQHDVRVAFDVPNNRIRVHEDDDNDNAMDANERVTFTPLQDGVVLAKATAPAVTYSTGGLGAATVNFTLQQGGMPVVVFRRDGSASESGGFYLTTRKAVASGSTRQSRAGEVIRATGRIIWYSYGTGAWRRGN